MNSNIGKDNNSFQENSSITSLNHSFGNLQIKCDGNLIFR